MSEHRSERVIEGEARPEWGRLPVAAVVVVSFLLAAIVGMTSAASPWLPGDGGRSSPPAIVGQVLAVALAAGLCILLGLIWIHTPRRSKARKKPGGPAIVTEEVGSSLRAGSLVLIGGILVVVALVIAFWFLLEQADLAQPPPPRRDDDRGRRCPASAGAAPVRATGLRLVPLRVGRLDRGRPAPRARRPSQASGDRPGAGGE